MTQVKTKRSVNKKTVFIISLGCAKNTVDSDGMAQLLTKAGYRLVESPQQAGVLLVNTCGFIEPARRESYDILTELALNKRKDQFLIAAGCLSQRYGQEVVQRVPEVNGVLGARRWMDIVEIVDKLRRQEQPKVLYHLPETPTVGKDERGAIGASIQGNSAYLKIADGCRRPCAFCAIPLIKGTTVSRPMTTLLDEARFLQARGVKEIVLIAQDTTDYGRDLGMEDGLSTLLEGLVNAAPEIAWWRIMYAFPGLISDRLINVMAAHPQILPYLDLPLQHAHPDMLKRMQRPANIDRVRRSLDKIRCALPGLAIRTTFIVGFPGETEAEFQSLCEFVKEMQFDRLGVFQFSFEKGVPADHLGDPIPAEVKEQRYQTIMELQQSISLTKNQSFVGQTLNILVEGQGDIEDADAEISPPQRISLGRSYRDAPEIDGLVFVEGEAPVGEIIPVCITGALAYDLSGVMV
ncbi:MAG: 30S ribosomal protein S12 methylthiotransferase RimO [Anaerolineales bacterium]|nr:30S ribosomal protein S12 methylthiotransferase RimO [Anaerolineales bacterium]